MTRRDDVGGESDGAADDDTGDDAGSDAGGDHGGREVHGTARQPTEDEGPADNGPRSGSGGDGGTVSTYRCDLCGNVMLDLHCKLICERCGYKRDCSDP